MQYREATIIVATDSLRRHGARDDYRVLDLNGRYHGFHSAAEANAVFPGAFDEHPDYDTETETE